MHLLDKYLLRYFGMFKELKESMFNELIKRIRIIFLPNRESNEVRETKEGEGEEEEEEEEGEEKRRRGKRRRKRKRIMPINFQ